jgi:hypothetical protein
MAGIVLDSALLLPKHTPPPTDKQRCNRRKRFEQAPTRQMAGLYSLHQGDNGGGLCAVPWVAWCVEGGRI